MTTLTQTAKILSVPPVFDARLATSLLKAVGVSPRNDEVSEAELGNDVVRKLARSGLVNSFATWWRFAESVRHDFVRSLQRDEPAVYELVADAVVYAMSNGSGELMRQALGERGAQLTSTVFELASSAREERAFQGLVDQLGTSAGAGRIGDVHAVSRLMRDLPISSDRERQNRFISGLGAWQDDRRREAATHFAFVWQAQVEDRAYGIAAHLLAAFEQAERRTESAFQFAVAAVKVLRRLGDLRGEALALTTLGRIERDLVDMGSELAGGVDPIETLERAVQVGREVSPRHAGIALGYLAGALQHLRRWDEALEVAQEAEAVIPDDDEAQLPILTALGSLYRSTGRFDDSRRALKRGVDIAESAEDYLQEAILLNVLAGSERYVGMLDDAVRHARRSVEIGLMLGHRRHLSQAYNTLARVLLDAASTPQNLREALDAATNSEQILKELNDRRGLSFIQKTIQQIESKLRDRAH